jgi:hypothetical protein
MTFTIVDDAIPLMPGTMAYNMRASGNIYKGQAVTLSPGLDSHVMATSNSSQRVFGVAGYSQYHNSSIAIYGKLNVIRAKLSGSQTAGTLVGGYYNGMFHNSSKYLDAIVTKGTNSTGDGEIMLF